MERWWLLLGKPEIFMHFFSFVTITQGLWRFNNLPQSSIITALTLSCCLFFFKHFCSLSLSISLPLILLWKVSHNQKWVIFCNKNWHISTKLLNKKIYMKFIVRKIRFLFGKISNIMLMWKTHLLANIFNSLKDSSQTHQPDVGRIFFCLQKVCPTSSQEATRTLFLRWIMCEMMCTLTLSVKITHKTKISLETFHQTTSALAQTT